MTTIKANYPTRHEYPLYKFFNEPEEWEKTGRVKVKCKEGRVEIEIFETDSILVHTLNIRSDDGPVGCCLMEEMEPVQE